jgi:hypothetical protein
MLWEMTAGLNNEFRLLVPGETDKDWSRHLQAEGEPLSWQERPKVEPFVDSRRKKQKPRGDIEYVTWGAIVLNAKAMALLAEKLKPFGQFLEIDCLGEIHYFYNVTTLVNVVVYEKSGRNSAAVTKPQFFPHATPSVFCIFKDPLTATIAIYLTEQAKAELAAIIDANKITGLYFVPAGSI